jgi:hypothetical protein
MYTNVSTDTQIEFIKIDISDDEDDNVFYDNDNINIGKYKIIHI